MGPEPRIHPIWMVAIFSFLIAVCCGPAYNFNAFRGFLRESGFLDGAPDAAELVTESGKIFQTVDIIFGCIVGLIYEIAGPRISHGLGYVFFAVGILLMSSWKSLWFGMALQGASSVFLLNTVLHLSNLFTRGSKFVMAFFSAIVELATFIFPALRFGLSLNISGTTLLWALTSIPVIGLIATILLFPDEPFFPRSEEVREAISSKPRKTSLSQDEVRSYSKPDSRDHWGNDIETLSKGGDSESSTLISPSTSVQAPPMRIQRLSRLSISLAALAEPKETPKIGKGVWSLLLSPEWLLITIVFSFFVFRTNLYFDGNEDMLHYMGDVDNYYINLFSYYMMFSIVAGLLNGLSIHFAGLMSTACILNLCAMSVNILSMSNKLNLQSITIVLFIFSRASTYSILIVYTAEVLGLKHFVALTGVSMVVGGTINIFLGIKVVRYVASKGPEEWYWINWYLVIGGVVTFVALFFLWFLQHGKKAAFMRKKPIQQELE